MNDDERASRAKARKVFRARHGDRLRAEGRIRNWVRYGITDIEHAQMVWDAQTDICELCKQPGTFHLDHDHQTGKVRGVLCSKCNHGLGLFNDDPALIRAAADYVELHK